MKKRTIKSAKLDHIKMRTKTTFFQKYMIAKYNNCCLHVYSVKHADKIEVRFVYFSMSFIYKKYL